ncbi:MAG: peptide chain release factor N(5)-glutamine methyltransferase [Pelagibacteraceae bacterium]|nr:peptide chain release factor N(5)-glutamine methyltransferase [Pelagibacteraceae bacterium]
MNIQKAISEGQDILMNKNIKTSELDSEILMANVIDKDRKYIILNLNEELKEEYLKKFRNLIEKRSKKEPIAYLINKKEFWNSEFFVSRHTLIPRPDTELIVDQILKITKNKNKLNILDIGIGSGCILLTILKERSSFNGTGIDVSKNCIKISKINAIKLKVDHRTKLFKTNVDKFNHGKYDIIVSNPPYINKIDIKYLEKDVVNFEPKSALYGGLDGTSEIRKVINSSSELIKKNGKFILEIGFDQKNKVIQLLKKKGFFINSVVKDLAKHDRCIISTKI